MFRKTSKTSQLDLFSSVTQYFTKSALNQFSDSASWHNQFFEHVYCLINEDKFSVLFSENNGAPNASVRIILSMMILKEGFGWSDQELFENCRFNLLVRKSLGICNLDVPIPVESTYYLLRKRITEHLKNTGEDLFEVVFKEITKSQIIEFNVSGRSIRMDSKLIGSNIAFFTRYEIIHRTLSLFYKTVKNEFFGNLDQEDRQQLSSIIDEKAAQTVYTSTKESVKKRLHVIGNLIYKIIQLGQDINNKEFDLLKRVFEEQYKIEEEKIELRPKEEITSSTVQSPYDVDCAYRKKDDESVKGFSHNIGETCEENQLNLITDIEVEKANVPDNEFVIPSIENTQEVLQPADEINNIHTDGAYNSQDNQEFTKAKDINFNLTGIQGSVGRYDLIPTENGELTIIDTETDTEVETTKTKSGNYRIDTENGYRYFGQKEIERSILRKQIENLPPEIANKRNNVEATIFQFSLHLRNNKTKYRGIIKNRIWARLRCLWINLCRIVKYVKEKCEKRQSGVKNSLHLFLEIKKGVIRIFNISIRIAWIEKNQPMESLISNIQFSRR